MHLYGCSIGGGTVIIRLMAVHRGLVQVFDLEAFEQGEYGMGLMEVIINCSVVSMSAVYFKGLRNTAYQC